MLSKSKAADVTTSKCGTVEAKHTTVYVGMNNCRRNNDWMARDRMAVAAKGVGRIHIRAYIFFCLGGVLREEGICDLLE